jgi:DNA replication protein DnaC
MSNAVAKNFMAEMKLLGMFAAFDQAVTAATRDQTSYTEFLDTLLQAENDYRQERKTGYRIKAAKFTLRPAFEDIDFTASRSISKAQIKELYGLQWLSEGRPVLLIGQTGVGKTFIAQATGLHACACGKSVLYLTLTTWLENVALARSSGTYLRYRDKLAKPDVLILDLCAADRYVESDADTAAIPETSASPSPHKYACHSRRSQLTTSNCASATRPARGAASTSGNTCARACRFKSRSALA